MQTKKTFSEWFTHPYAVIVRDEENFEQRRSFKISYAKIMVFGVLIFGFMLLPVYFVSDALQALFERKNPIESKEAKLLTLISKVDSLELLSQHQETYLQKLNEIIRGDIHPDILEKEIQKEAENAIDWAEVEALNPIDSQFRKEFESKGGATPSGNRMKRDLGNIVLFAPAEGFVTRKYDPIQEHFGVDIVTPKANESIKSIASGTVIIASWTQDTGHVIGIQHPNQMVSFYKHNSVLLKKVGDFVDAGTAIAIIGNSGELTDGPHLHFEIWYDGSPVNPEDFISF
ncbi:MAG: M23 family metallopeptidase [Bernardetiaceae bacterium]|nr:M23 family metallopeptidase [Bernardetiaceae bacterium]